GGERERRDHHAHLIVRGPPDVALGVNRPREVIVEIATFRHLAQKRLECERLIANGGQPARGRRFRRIACGQDDLGCGDGADGSEEEGEKAGEAAGAQARPERHHLTRVPGSGGASNPTSIGLPPSVLAARTIPFDSIPISFAGFRLKTTTTVRPTSASGSYASAMPATSVRCSLPTSTWSLISLLDFGTRSAASTFATRSSTFMKSSIEIRAGSAGMAGADAAAAAAAGAAAGVVSGLSLTRIAS